MILFSDLFLWIKSLLNLNYDKISSVVFITFAGIDKVLNDAWGDKAHGCNRFNYC